jgi:excisionase family DNA binding protein
MMAEIVVPDKLFTVDDAAKACGVCGATIRRWIRNKRLKCVLFGPTKRLRITATELQRVMEGEK